MRFSHLSSRLLLVLAIILSVFLIFSQSLLAVEVSTGLAAVEEGDDRLRPAATLHLGLGDKFYSNVYYYGRKFGPVSQTTALMSLNYPFVVVPKSVRAGIGFTSLVERTTIKIPDEPIEDEKSYNFGVSLGLAWAPEINPWYFSLGAESHLFMAGQAMIFLSTARKETISATVGLRW